MPKRETEYKAALLLDKEGEFFPFTLYDISHVVSHFDVLDPGTKQPVIDAKTGLPKKKEQLKFIFRTEVNGTLQEITEWAPNFVPMKEFNDRNKFGKIAKAFGILDSLYKDFRGFEIMLPEELAAIKVLFNDKVAEGLIKVKQTEDGMPVVKIETWKASKKEAVASGKKKAPF